MCLVRARERASCRPSPLRRRLHACAWTMVDLQTEALIGIAVIGIALVTFGLYPIAKLALSQRKPRSARVSATSEERDGLVTNKPKEKTKPKKKASKKKNASKKEEIKKIAYYKIPVSFEIRGNFIGYIKFKRALSLSNKMLNFDKESVKVVKSTDSTGAINVSGVLTIVGLADEFY